MRSESCALWLRLCRASCQQVVTALRGKARALAQLLAEQEQVGNLDQRGQRKQRFLDLFANDGADLIAAGDAAADSLAVEATEELVEADADQVGHRQHVLYLHAALTAQPAADDVGVLAQRFAELYGVPALLVHDFAQQFHHCFADFGPTDGALAHFPSPHLSGGF